VCLAAISAKPAAVVKRLEMMADVEAPKESPSLDSLTDPASHLAQHLLNTVPAGWRAGALDSRGHSLGHVVDILLRTRERFGALRYQPSQSSGDLITPPNMSACPRHAGDPPPRGQHPVLAQDPTVYQRRRPAFDVFFGFSTYSSLSLLAKALARSALEPWPKERRTSPSSPPPFRWIASASSSCSG
jgi:hypothetical protein